MKFLRITTPVLLALCSLLPLSAAADTVVDLNLYHVMQVRDTGEEVSSLYTMAGEASVSFKSPNEGNVRGDVALSIVDMFKSGNWIPVVQIDRAYLRVRFPSFRLTAGKTRVGWGDGMLFNAADVLFGSTDTGVNLQDQELRTSTKWLTSVNIPLGAFSFVEAVVVPPEDLADAELWKTTLGARYYTTVGSMKVETGAAYRADHTSGNPTGQVVSPYIALQGNVGADWYVATSANLAYPEDIAEELKDSWMLSAGLFHLVNVGWQGTLSFRLETLVRPFGDWEATNEADKNYGLYLYPEISYAPSDTWSLSLRSIVSPLDMSAVVMVGGSWNVLQGFSFNGYVTANAGESDDAFPWQSASALSPSVSATVGMSWVY
ncbi:MAG: hypothetical protein CVV46_05165 [Spirochaetae bacterium HGW-Spirochaetae-2]|jgi:hypothetical protein|nr:MAG: hypothetical protein CVV46_05165 [Spirochaetae bacterium HGW-Spirochaetae-2]